MEPEVSADSPWLSAWGHFPTRGTGKGPDSSWALHWGQVRETGVQAAEVAGTRRAGYKRGENLHREGASETAIEVPLHLSQMLSCVCAGQDFTGLAENSSWGPRDEGSFGKSHSAGVPTSQSGDT